MLYVLQRDKLENAPINTYQARLALGVANTETGADFFIEAACDFIESLSGYTIIPSRYVIQGNTVFDQELGYYIALPFPPIREVEKVEVLESINTYRELSQDEYKVFDSGTKLILLNRNLALVRVTYTAGYTNTTFPNDLFSHIVNVAYHFLMNREFPPPPATLKRFTNQYLEKML